MQPLRSPSSQKSGKSQRLNVGAIHQLVDLPLVPENRREETPGVGFDSKAQSQLQADLNASHSRNASPGPPGCLSTGRSGEGSHRLMIANAIYGKSPDSELSPGAESVHSKLEKTLTTGLNPREGGTGHKGSNRNPKIEADPVSRNVHLGLHHVGDKLLASKTTTKSLKLKNAPPRVAQLKSYYQQPPSKLAPEGLQKLVQ